MFWIECVPACVQINASEEAKTKEEKKKKTYTQSTETGNIVSSLRNAGIHVCIWTTNTHKLHSEDWFIIFTHFFFRREKIIIMIGAALTRRLHFSSIQSSKLNKLSILGSSTFMLFVYEVSWIERVARKWINCPGGKWVNSKLKRKLATQPASIWHLRNCGNFESISGPFVDQHSQACSCWFLSTISGLVRGSVNSFLSTIFR